MAAFQTPLARRRLKRIIRFRYSQSDDQFVSYAFCELPTGRVLRVEQKVVGDNTLAYNLGDHISSFMLQDQDTWTCYIMSHITVRIMPHHQCLRELTDC
jgi:hypothetical protein